MNMIAGLAFFFFTAVFFVFSLIYLFFKAIVKEPFDGRILGYLSLPILGCSLLIVLDLVFATIWSEPS